MIHTNLMGDYLPFREIVTQHNFVNTINDLLLIEEQVTRHNFYNQITDRLGFTETKQYGNLTNLLVQDQLTISDYIHNFRIFTFTDVLTLIEYYVLGSTNTSSESLRINEEITVRRLPRNNITDTLILEDTFSAYVIDERPYNFDHTSSILSLEPEEIIAAIYSDTACTAVDNIITLSSTGHGSINIKAPEFGNTLEIQQSRIQRRSRGNILILFRPDYWPQSKKMHLEFSGLTTLEKINLVNFVNNTVGERITIFDHNRISLSNCRITNPNINIQQEKDCSYRTTLEIEEFING